MSSSPLILLAAGGTGGHVFPAEALAAELLQRGYRLGLVTDRRGRSYGGVLGGLDKYALAAGTIYGRGRLAKLKGALGLAQGLGQAFALLGRLRPALVVGFGGYPSLPPVLAASLRGIPTLILEQNAVLGRANRLLYPRVGRVAVCYPQVRYAEAPGAKVVLTGNPVRPAILAQADQPYVPPTADGALHLFVMGGSQGARALSDLVPAALLTLPPEIQSRIILSQQCRPEDIGRVRALYEAAGLKASLESFFANVPERLAAAHLVISRAGASTIAELTALGRPAILIPLPHSLDDDQTANATALVERGGAWLMPERDLTAERLSQQIQTLLLSPPTLTQAAQAAGQAGIKDAARRLADLAVQEIRL